VIAIGVPIWLQYVAKRRASEERQKRTQAHWTILGKEIEFCIAKAQWYIAGKSDAPLYRLDSPAFEKSLPALVSDAQPSGSDFKAILSFYSWVGDINRGLERAADQPSWNTDTVESTRVKDKCAALIREYYGPIQKALKEHGVVLMDPDAIAQAFKR